MSTEPENTAEASSQSKWNAYFVWYDAESVIVLVSRPRVRKTLIGLAGLSEAQQDELRGIFTASLRKMSEAYRGP
jgi:hypothetical protein